MSTGWISDSHLKRSCLVGRGRFSSNVELSNISHFSFTTTSLGRVNSLCIKSTLVRGYSKEYYIVTLVVYNPCTEQTRLINPRFFYSRSGMSAFGYKNNDNYKILRFSNCSVRRSMSLTLIHGGFSCRVFQGKNLLIIFLIRFDFTEERFQRLALPFRCDSLYLTVALSTVREENFAVFFLKKVKSKIEIWLTNEPNDDESSWSMFFKVDLSDKFMLGSSSMSFMVDEENKLALCCDPYLRDYDNWRDGDENRITIYIVGEGVFRQVGLFGETDVFQAMNWRPFLFSYVPSLVQI